eukprot:712295-Rhodomonas_salina.1
MPGTDIRDNPPPTTADCYAMSGTELAYPTTRRSVLLGVVSYGYAIRLHPSYDMCGTDVAYGSARLLGNVGY